MTKPTIVLLHGVGLDHTVWEPVAERLSDPFTLVMPDLLGHGDGPPAPPGATLSVLADAVIDQIPTAAHLIGFSLGGLIAEDIALRRPDLVTTLVVVSSVCQRTPTEREAVLARLEVAGANFPATVAASLHRWFDGADIDPDWVDRTEATLRGNDVESFLTCYRIFATADAELAPHLAEITAPTLAITGGLDLGSTPEMSRRLAAAVPNGRSVVVPNVRHMLPIEDPDALCDSVVTFIGENAHV